MRWTVGMKRIIVTAMALVALCCGTASALGGLEGKRIEFLIASVENLNGAKFVRNGSVYDGKQAAAHLRMKYQSAGEKVQSAEDFINICASKSYISGKAYLIVFSNGQTMPTEQFFRQKLREYH
jgi:hypothetical protein